MYILSLLLSILGVISIASAFPSRISKPGRLSQKLDANADEDSLRYQPAFYFNKGTCDRTKAIANDTTVNTGVSNYPHCLQRSLLSDRKVYTRKRCNNGWCAYMYEYNLAWGISYAYRSPRWENIVVFVKNNTIQHVAASESGVYIRRDKLHLQEGHPLMLNSGPVSQLSVVFRFANKGHVEKIRKDVGEWVTANLVDWDGSPAPALNKTSSPYDGWREKFHLADEHFTDTLYEAAGECVSGFDCESGETKDMQKEKQKEKVKVKDKPEVDEKDPEKKFNIKEDKEAKNDKKDDEKDEKEKKFDIKENGKGKEDKNDKKEDDKNDKKDEKKENKFDIKENGKDKEDKKENENEDDKDDKDDKDGKDDKDDKKEENQFDIKKQKDEDK